MLLTVGKSCLEFQPDTLDMVLWTMCDMLTYDEGCIAAKQSRNYAVPLALEVLRQFINTPEYSSHVIHSCAIIYFYTNDVEHPRQYVSSDSTQDPSTPDGCFLSFSSQPTPDTPEKEEESKEKEKKESSK